MPAYRYKAINKKGSTVIGSFTAANLDELTDMLRAQHLFLVEGSLADQTTTAKAEAKAEPARTAVQAEPEKRLPLSTDKIPEALVANFTTELQIMVSSALPLLEALESLAKQQHDPAFKALLWEVVKLVREGRSLSYSFSRYPKVFNQVYISLLEAGEASGTLPDMLTRIANYMNFQIELKGKVRSAMMYPLIVICVSLSVVSFIVLFVLPTFQEVFDSLAVDLPLPTKFLLAVSANGRKWWYLYILGGYAVYHYVSVWFTSPNNAEVVDRWKLKLPGLGKLVRNLVLTRVLRTLGALVTSGVPILKCLQLATGIAGNKVFSDLLQVVYREVSEGHGLAAALTGNPYFPETIANMIANAEKTGTLPTVLNQVADYYEREIDRALKEMFAIIEPAFVVLLGLMVGGIAVSILMPIFQIGGAIE